MAPAFTLFPIIFQFLCSLCDQNFPVFYASGPLDSIDYQTPMWIFNKSEEDDIKKAQEKAAKDQANKKGVKMTPQELQIQADSTIKKILEINSSSNWEKIDDKPCTIYTMKAGERVITKGEANIKVSAKALEDHIDDQKNYLPDNVSVNKVVTEGPFGMVKYRKHKSVWPVDDRDLVLLKTKHHEGNRTIIGVRSINYDIPLQKGVIRAQQNIGGFIIEKISQNQCKLTHLADLDLKGSIPGVIKKKISEAQGKVPAKFKEVLEKKK